MKIRREAKTENATTLLEPSSFVDNVKKNDQKLSKSIRCQALSHGHNGHFEFFHRFKLFS